MILLLAFLASVAANACSVHGEACVCTNTPAASDCLAAGKLLADASGAPVIGLCNTTVVPARCEYSVFGAPTHVKTVGGSNDGMIGAAQTAASTTTSATWPFGVGTVGYCTVFVGPLVDRTQVGSRPAPTGPVTRTVVEPCTSTTNPLSVRTDLSVKKAIVGVPTPGMPVKFQLNVTNAFATPAPATAITDVLSAFGACAWTCTSSSGACAVPAGVGSIALTVTMPAASTWTFDITCTLSPTACTATTNTATVTVGPAITDVVLTNNGATVAAAVPAGAPCDDGRTTTDRDQCFDSICVSCPDIQRCTAPNAITIQLSNGTQVCGLTTPTFVNGELVTLQINSWTPSSIVNANSQSINLNLFLGQYAVSENDGVRTLVCIGGACNAAPYGRRIVFSVPGVAPCFVQFIVNSSGAKRQAPVVTTFGGAHLFPLVANAIGDPHIVGPNGEKFDWTGEPGRVYALFTSPLFQVNVHMSKESATNAGHFMTKVVVLHRDVVVSSDMTLHQPLFVEAIERVNAQLAPLGGKASAIIERDAFGELAPPKMVLDLCAGHRVIITRHVPSTRQTSELHLFETTEYFDVEIEVPGCHDAFDGVVGQLYQCQYERGAKFVWDANNEQRFRLPSLTTPSRSFNHHAPCLERERFGAQLSPVAAVH